MKHPETAYRFNCRAGNRRYQALDIYWWLSAHGIGALMPWVEELSDPGELRRCIRDLVALSTLPALWREYSAKEIANSVALALQSILSADFVHVTISLGHDEEPITATHGPRGQMPREVNEAIRLEIAPEW